MDVPRDDAPAQTAPERAAIGTVAAGDFYAGLHPLHRRFLAYREGLTDGTPHTLEEAAERFGLDLATARITEQYLAARRRLHLDRAGWRASHLSSW